MIDKIEQVKKIISDETLGLYGEELDIVAQQIDALYASQQPEMVVCPNNPCKKGCVDSEDAIRADERTKTLKEVGEWLKKIAELEQCDSSVMAYFDDYYWVERTEFESILANLKSGKKPQEKGK
ncbi:MAG: hypothetical protein WC822_04960 [Candidatus Paceibacterota bacterium]|jgi:hypothetical protein